MQAGYMYLYCKMCDTPHRLCNDGILRAHRIPVRDSTMMPNGRPIFEKRCSGGRVAPTDALEIAGELDLWRYKMGLV